MAPSHILQIFLRVAIQNQIRIAKWVSSSTQPVSMLKWQALASYFMFVSSYNKIVVFIDRSPAECYNSFRVLWIGEALLPQRRFLGGSNHSFFVEMLIS